jgi:hypothetical protein
VLSNGFYSSYVEQNQHLAKVYLTNLHSPFSKEESPLLKGDDPFIHPSLRLLALFQPRLLGDSRIESNGKVNRENHPSEVE